MKKLTWAFILLCAFGNTVVSANTAGEPSHVPVNPNSQFNGTLSYYGASKYYIESSTPTDTAVQMFVGSGYFYGAACSSGTIGDYMVPFDTATPSGITIATTGHAITPQVFSVPIVLGSTSAPSGLFGKFETNFGPMRVSNGLAAIKHGVTGGADNCVIWALSDAEISAGSH